MLVLSPVVDANLYVTVMELGAFDFLTPETPPEGIAWILNGVIRRDALAAAQSDSTAAPPPVLSLIEGG